MWEEKNVCVCACERTLPVRSITFRLWHEVDGDALGVVQLLHVKGRQKDELLAGALSGEPDEGVDADLPGDHVHEDVHLVQQAKGRRADLPEGNDEGDGGVGALPARQRLGGRVDGTGRLGRLTAAVLADKLLLVARVDDHLQGLRLLLLPILAHHVVEVRRYGAAKLLLLEHVRKEEVDNSGHVVAHMVVRSLALLHRLLEQLNVVVHDLELAGESFHYCHEILVLRNHFPLLLRIGHLLVLGYYLLKPLNFRLHVTQRTFSFYNFAIGAFQSSLAGNIVLLKFLLNDLF